MAADERGLVELLVKSFYQNQIDHQNTAEGSSEQDADSNPGQAVKPPPLL